MNTVSEAELFSLQIDVTNSKAMWYSHEITLACNVITWHHNAGVVLIGNDRLRSTRLLHIPWLQIGAKPSITTILYCDDSVAWIISYNKYIVLNYQSKASKKVRGLVSLKLVVFFFSHRIDLMNGQIRISQTVTIMITRVGCTYRKAS